MHTWDPAATKVHRHPLGSLSSKSQDIYTRTLAKFLRFAFLVCDDPSYLPEPAISADERDAFQRQGTFIGEAQEAMAEAAQDAMAEAAQDALLLAFQGRGFKSATLVKWFLRLLYVTSPDGLTALGHTNSHLVYCLRYAIFGSPGWFDLIVFMVAPPSYMR